MHSFSHRFLSLWPHTIISWDSALLVQLQASILRPLWPWLHQNFKANHRGIMANSGGTMAMVDMCMLQIFIIIIINGRGGRG